MSDKFDAFEQIVRKKIDGHKVEYRPTDWIELEHSLDKLDRLRKVKRSFVVAAGIGVVAITSFFIFNNFDDDLIESEPKQSQVLTIDKLDTIDLSNSINSSKNKTSSQDSHSTENVDESSKDFSDKQKGPLNETSIAFTDVDSNKGNKESRSKKDGTDKSKQKEIKIEEAKYVDSQSNNTKEDEEARHIEMIKNQIAEKLNVSASIVPSSYVFCEGDEISLRNESTYYNGVIYKWLINKKEITSSLKATSQLDQIGSNEVTLQLISLETGNLLSEDKIDIEVLSKPNADFSWDIDNSNLKTQYNFKTDDSELNDSRWFIEDDDYTGNTINHVFNSPGSKNVKLTTKSENGCSSEENMTINVVNIYNLNVSEEFSFSEGELFMPSELEEIKKTFTLEILDLQNNVIFTSSSFHDKWNGKEAIEKQIKKFKWVVKIKVNSTTTEEIKGEVRVK